MSVNALIFVGGDRAVGRNAVVNVENSTLCGVEHVIKQLPAAVTSVTLLADVEQPKVNELSLPVIYADFYQKDFLTNLYKALNEQSQSRMLVLSGEDVRFTKEHYSQLLDQSERLPHMTVISTREGKQLPFPLIFPAGISEDIAEFLSESKGSVSDWLEHSVYMECELSDIPLPV